MKKSSPYLYHHAIKLAKKVDWHNWDFSWTKSNIAAIFSSLAYEYIPSFELENTERAKLIPCENYQERIAQQKFISKDQLRNSLETNFPIVIIENKYFVAFITKINEVAFVALRGTSNLYDVGVDINIRKTKHPPYKSSLIKFHRGFFDAISADFAGIIRALYKMNDNGTPLYVTGHSLGGALAAILDILLHDRFSLNSWWRAPINPDNFRPIASYTFGMPRYGNRYAISYCRTPFHVYNQKDMVPTLPPRFLGFSDLHKEFCLDSSAKLLPNYIKGSCGLRYSSKKIKFLSASEHKMERYIAQVELARQVGAD